MNEKDDQKKEYHKFMIIEIKTGEVWLDVDNTLHPG
jgi:hypothetical protein